MKILHLRNIHRAFLSLAFSGIYNQPFPCFCCPTEIGWHPDSVHESLFIYFVFEKKNSRRQETHILVNLIYLHIFQNTPLIQYRFPSLIQPLNSSLTHYSLALRYRGGTGTITQWIDNWNYWNDIGHTIPLHAGNRRAPEKSLNSGDFFLIMNSVSTNIEINI